MSLTFVVPQITVPVISKPSLLFPVRRIYCIGRNYIAHATEMGQSTNRANPFFFTKPTDAAVVQATTRDEMFQQMDSHITMTYPPMTECYHHEVELVVAIGPNAEGHTRLDNVSPEEAAEFIYGYAIGLDMTRRDLQSAAKSAGQPWDLAKGADESAGISSIVRAADLEAQHPELFVNTATGERVRYMCNGAIALSVNNNPRQDGNLAHMVNTAPEVIAHLSHYVTLRQGDLVYTGTPAGVGPVRRGDLVTATIEGLGALTAAIQ